MKFNEKIRAVCRRFPTIFSDKLPNDPALLPPFRVKLDRARWEVSQSQQTTELQKLTIIEHSNAAHYSQVILAPNPHTNKTEWRFCIDYRPPFLNDLISSLSWPLPSIKRMFERLGARIAKYFAEWTLRRDFTKLQWIKRPLSSRPL